jgi:hypothetical protein
MFVGKQEENEQMYRVPVKPLATFFNPLTPNDIYIYIYMSYRTANLQTLHFIYLVNKYTY